jgi:20S proteasome subunit alpha 1
MLVTGMQADARAIVQTARAEAAKWSHTYGYPMAADQLARFLADRAQVYTQHAYMRPLGVIPLVAGIDEEGGGPQLWKVDPAGHAAGYRGAGAGTKDLEVEAHLEKAFRAPASTAGLSADATIQAALGALTAVLGEDFKANEVEVGVVRADEGGRFRVLSEAEVDAHLVALAERD